MKDRPVIRLGAALGLVAAMLAVLANLLHPRTPVDSDSAWFSVIADSGLWNLVHLLVAIATLLVLAGLYALARRVQDTPGAAWASVALVMGIAGGAVALVHAAIDGFAFKVVAERWAEAGAPVEGAIYELVQTMDAVSGGLFNVFNGTLLGAVPLLGGIAVLRSGLFGGWVGVVGIAGGVIDMALAVYGSLGSELTPFLSNAVLTAGAMLVTIWAIVTNWSMFKEAGEPAQVVEPQAARS